MKQKNVRKILTHEESSIVCGFVTKALEKGIPIEDIFDILDKWSQSTNTGTIFKY